MKIKDNIKFYILDLFFRLIQQSKRIFIVRVFAVFSLCFFSLQSFAQVDKDFWFVAPYITQYHEGNFDTKFVITAMGLPANVVIEEPANNSFITIDTTIAAYQSIVINMAPNYLSKNYGAIYISNTFANFNLEDILPGPENIPPTASLPAFQKILNFGLHIFSDQDISVYYDIVGGTLPFVGWNMETYTLKGQNAYGTNFYCPFQNLWPEDLRGWDDDYSNIDIVATQDLTQVLIVPTCHTSLYKDGEDYPTANNPGDSIRILLNKGQTFSVRCASHQHLMGAVDPHTGLHCFDYLGGTHITSNNPIAITLTDDSVHPTCGGCADAAGDQLIPTTLCGEQYIVMSSKLNASCEGWCFIDATQPGTLVQYYNMTLATWVTTPPLNPYPGANFNYPLQIPAGQKFMLLKANHPICILHIAGFVCEVGGAILPSIQNCTGSTSVSSFRLNRNTDAFFMNMMVRDGAQNSFYIITPCGDSIHIDSAFFQKVPGSGKFYVDTATTDRGWWVMRDSVKRFGDEQWDLLPLMTTPVAITPEFMNKCGVGTVDGDISGNGVNGVTTAVAGFKNGFPIAMNATTRIINTKDFFHLGIYTGGPGNTCQYGYFSSFNQQRGNSQTVETGQSSSKVCYKDTVSLYANGGLSYSWYYDPLNQDTLPKFTRQYLTPADTNQAECRAYGFSMAPNDSLKVFWFRVKIHRSICFGDTTPPVTIFMNGPIYTNVAFSKTQFCSGDTITVTNHTTGASDNSTFWKYWDSYNKTPRPASNLWPNLPMSQPWDTSFKLTFTIPPDSTKNKTINLMFVAQKNQCQQILYQDLLIYPGVTAKFGATPVSGCNPLEVNFSDSSIGMSINNRLWTFGDGASGFTPNISHTYFNSLFTKDTTFKATLQINNNNCQSTKSVSINVTRQLQSNFALDTTATCSPHTTFNIVSNAKGGSTTIFEVHYGAGLGVNSIIDTINKTNDITFTFQVDTLSTLRVDTVIQLVNYKTCQVSSSSLITIYPGVSAKFSPSDTFGCSPLLVNFKRPNNKVPVSMFWNFGDGNTSVDTTPTIQHTFRNLGNKDTTYTTMLVVQSQYLCRDTFKQTIHVPVEISANFSVDTLQGCTPLKVKITNNSRDPSNQCNFVSNDIGVPTNDTFLTTKAIAVFSLTLGNPTASVTIDSLQLTVSDSASCISKETFPIRLFPDVAANFSLSDSTGCQPLVVLCTNNTPNTIANIINWNFGDQSSSSSKDTVTHVFSNLSSDDTIYNIKMIAYTVYGCTDTLIKPLKLCAYLKADFNTNIGSGCSPLTVVINNESIESSAIQKYTLVFGDGSANLTSPIFPVTHTYVNFANSSPQRNLKLIISRTLTVVNSTKTLTCEDSLINPIIVYPLVQPSFTVDTSQTLGCQPMRVVFKNSTDVVGKEFNWTFGDGTSYSGRDTTHIYQNPGINDLIRTVTLSAQSQNNCSSDTSMNLTVYGYFKAGFNIPLNSVCSGLPVTISNNSTDPSQITTYTWYFNKTKVTNSNLTQQPSFQYTFPIDYTSYRGDSDIVKLVVTTLHNCKDSTQSLVIIYPKVISNFEIQKNLNGIWISDSASCSPFTAQLFNLTKNADYYQWQMWDGGTSTELSPVHNFINTNDNDIKKPIKLIATSQYQCVDSVTHWIIVYQTPTVAFEATPYIGCNPLPVTFANNTITNGSTFYWDFDDLAKDTTKSINDTVKHIFITTHVQPGTDEQFIVKVKAESNTGHCLDSNTLNIFVHPKVVAAFSVDSTHCEPYDAQFTNQSEQTAVTFLWNFGDSITSVSKDPIHLYPFAGYYPVSLTGYSVEGCTNTVKKQIHVYPQPQADFVANPVYQIYTPNNTVTIINSSTGTGTWQYTWNMGDGTVLNVQNPKPYTYKWWADSTNDYQYLITLNVTNGKCSDSSKQDITVKPAVPIASYDSLISSCPPITVQFNNNSLYADRGYYWNFGDGTSSTLANPTHYYDTAGTYLVVLKAFGEGGIGYKSYSLTIFQKPIANFIIGDSLDPMLPHAIIYCRNLSKYSNQYFWDFGDSPALDNEEDPQHQYYKLGTYWVTLIAISDSGCSDTMKYTEPVVVGGPGIIIFPNAFTPNVSGPTSSGKYNPANLDNSLFYPYYDGVVDYNLEIYNRWGELIFTSNDVTVGWDGYYKNKLCTQDVYVYKCKGTFLNGKNFFKSGDITLLIK